MQPRIRALTLTVFVPLLNSEHWLEKHSSTVTTAKQSEEPHAENLGVIFSNGNAVNHACFGIKENQPICWKRGNGMELHSNLKIESCHFFPGVDFAVVVQAAGLIVQQSAA